MYLVTIQVPIFVSGADRFLTTDWKRSLLLLRDSFDGRFGRIQVVAPRIDAANVKTDQALEVVHAADEIDLFPSFPENTRAREFWTSHLYAWRRDVAALLPSADVVHAGMCDVFRPMAYTGFLMGLQANKPTVFVQDTDQVLQMTELTVHATPRQRAKQLAYCYLYERGTRFGVARAGLSLLKGKALQDRYGRYAKNTKNFHDTSYLTSEIVPQQRVQARIADLLAAKRPVRLVYCGRLEARKGLSDSIAAVAQARARGARVTFDIIGDGVERAALEQAVQRSGAAEAVRFLGRRAYGPQLLADLGEYDALLFTPTAEDTPRMIFDGYAAGLPLVGYAIEYVRERDTEDRTVRSVPPRDITALSALLCELDRDRGQLAKLARRAHEAALFHAADAWYSAGPNGPTRPSPLTAADVHEQACGAGLSHVCDCLWTWTYYTGVMGMDGGEASRIDRRAADELSLAELVAEDFRTHDKELTSPGFWAVATHHVGERIDRIGSPLLRRPLTMLQVAAATAVDWVWGIHVPRGTKLGRRVHIWHFGSTLLNARAIGDDVHIRHDTTLGPVRSADRANPEALPTIEDAVDLGSGTCVMGGVTVGRGATIFANSVVLEPVPPGAKVFGVPGRIIPG